MPETQKLQLLSTSEVARRTGWKPNNLQRFTNEPLLRKWLGGGIDTHPSYSEESLPRFEELLRQHAEGVTPKMAVVAIKKAMASADAAGNGGGVFPGSPEAVDAEFHDASGNGNGNGNGYAPEASQMALVPVSQRLAQMTMPEVKSEVREIAIELAQVAIEELQKANALPRAEDRLMNREDTAKMLGCGPAAVGRRVKPVMAETWAYSEVQAYIADLIEKAKTKREQQAQKRASRKAAPFPPPSASSLTDKE